MAFLASGCGTEPECRADDPTCFERSLPGLLWFSTCQWKAPCLNRTVDAPALNVARDSSLYADCQRINIAHGDSSTSALRFLRSNDGGANWFITNVETGADLGYASNVLSIGETVYVSHFDANTADLRFGISFNMGKDWATVQVNSPLDDVTTDTGLAVRGGDIWLSTGISGLVLFRSSDNGATWTQISGDSNTGSGFETELIIEGDAIFVVSRDDPNQDLYFTRSFDYGQSWESILIEGAGNVGRYPTIVRMQNALFVAYYDASNTRYRLARSYDQGATWELSTIDSAADVGAYGRLTTDGSSLFAAYSDQTNGALKLARSLDQGSTWQTMVLDSGPNVGTDIGLSLAGPALYVSHRNAANQTLKMSSGSQGESCFFP
ncbi:MAG: exo-alpha-sialidase [Leptospiraceae bacterium]|nr:exo-alpha-sialidase [Leptospiraceae bacterium]